MRRKFRVLFAVFALVGLSTTFLAEPVSAKPKPRQVSPLTGTINVFAAASMTEAFTTISNVFRFLAPGVKINLNFAGSQTLVTQIQNGAPADVIVTADEANMRKLSSTNLLASDAFLFARNRLTILVHEGNAKGVGGLSDLARSDVSVSLCATVVPCGKFASQILANANVTVTPKSLENDVKGVVWKVATDEVDAGITYVTDGIAARFATDSVRIPDENNVINAYPVAVPRTVTNEYLAKVFIFFLFSPLAQNILALHGFMRA